MAHVYNTKSKRSRGSREKTIQSITKCRERRNSKITSRGIHKDLPGKITVPPAPIGRAEEICETCVFQSAGDLLEFTKRVGTMEVVTGRLFLT